MAEPRKVHFVTLAAFNAEPRKRRLDDEAELEAEQEAEQEGCGAAGGGGSGTGGLRQQQQAGGETRETVRLNLMLEEPDERVSMEFNYTDMMKAKNKSSNNLFNDEQRERLQLEALAKKMENKYGDLDQKRKDRIQDLVDIGFGYDETDPFIDNSEAYDELVPASLTTKLGGFYINTGTLQFRTASDSEGEEKKTSDEGEQMMNRRRKKEGLEEKHLNNRVSQQGVTAVDVHRPEKKKRKKLMKDSLYLAAMLRRFTREKDELRKINPNVAPAGPAGAVAQADPRENTSNSGHTGGDLSLAELTSDPSVMSLLGSANEKELQDLLGELDFNLLDSDHENGGVVGGVRVTGRGSSSGLYCPPPLPGGLPAPLLKRIEDLQAASRQFDQEGRKKFFTLDMNNILLDIELQVQDQPPQVRSEVYLHLEALVPCNKEALLKRLKKLRLNIQDERLHSPLLRMKMAVCSAMPEQVARYNMDCVAKAARQQSEEVDKNGSEEDDEEKPGKRVMGPRKKFHWDDKMRSLLCSLVRVKLSCYEDQSLSVEDYLKTFLETEVKLLWPKGWMQTRILFKESVAVHGHVTGHLVKRRTLPGPRSRTKEGLWIHGASLGTTSSTTSSTSTPRPPLMEPICLSDSLDEDLAVPSLDSISHALALLSNVSKGVGLSDSPLSPPPLQMPTSSPPPVAPHYPAAAPHMSLAAAAAHPTTLVSLQQHSQSKLAPALGLSPASSSSSTSSTRVQTASPASRAVDAQSLIKGQNQRLVAMATPNHRTTSVVSKTPRPPSPSPPKQRPPPAAASPLLSPHQKTFVPGVVVSPQGLCKSTSKSSNGGVSPSPAHPRTPAPSHFCPPHVAQPPQNKSHHATFITPMQATLTKSSLSSNSSPIIKLTPRPPAPTLSPVSSPSPSPSHPHPLLVNPPPRQYSPKTFRAPFSVPGAVKSVFSAAPSSGGGVITSQGVCSVADKAASAGQTARQRSVAGVGQISKAGNGWTSPASVSAASTTPHLSQVSSAGSPLLGCPSSLPLGFGMLGGLVPVSLPFQFPPLINFNSPAASGISPAPNSGFPLAQNDLMDLYKSLQSGSQAALPPHLQLTFSDANHSPGADMKRKNH